MLTLEGHLEHITYCNPETQYTIAKMKTGHLATPITVVGYLAGVKPGETLEVNGFWQTHPKYGQQLRIQSYAVILPVTLDGIRAYLESGVIKGIGPVLARRLVNAFGADTLHIIENTPNRLSDVEGVGDVKADMIAQAWKDHRVLRRLMQFLQAMEVQTSLCGRIYKEYGEDAVDLIREDPFVLAEDFPGDGFFIADTIARKQGIKTEEPQRVRACIIHLIMQNIDKGHTFAEEENLIARCQNLFQISNDAVLCGIDELIETKKIVAETLTGEFSFRALYLRELYQAEIGIVNRLNAMQSVPTETVDLDTQRIASEVHKKLAINLSSEQLEVLENVFSHRVAIITGGPGTGKTTLLRSISAIFGILGKRVTLAAPTGRAARRLAEMTDRKAGTIHRLLGYNPTDGQFNRNQDYPIDADAVIIDEASMVDILLMYRLINAIPITAALVLVGDVFQLPSVGPGSVLSDLICSNRIAVFHLNEIFRQNTESNIVITAHKVRQGELSVLETSDNLDDGSDFYFIELHDPEKVSARIVRLCSIELPQMFDLDPIHDIQVLTPMHKGAVGTINLNNVLQQVLNPEPAMIKTAGNTFKIGDKVMHLKNNYHKEIYNGDIGTICSIDKQDAKLMVEYYGRPVAYDFDELDEITIAYAISVHKSQGSEYPAVIVPIMTQHYALLQRNLLYTAMTRGKKIVIIIGTQKALGIALNNDKPRQRLSNLASRLKMNIP
ncbi:MAG: ATP-dependent RecD-like DNA helicase [Desulfobacterales bacterium]